MTIELNLLHLVGLVSVLLSYRPIFTAAVTAVKTGIKAYRFALVYWELPSRADRAEDRLDDLERAVFPEGATP